MTNLLVAASAILLLCLATGCPASSRLPYQKGMALLQAKNYTEAIEQFDKSLEADPMQHMPLFGKARCLYGLGQYQEALTLFEQFLQDTDRERAKFSDERFDAEFYRDKCKLELGMEVPQDPDAIPPEKMRY